MKYEVAGTLMNYKPIIIITAFVILLESIAKTVELFEGLIFTFLYTNDD